MLTRKPRIVNSWSVTRNPNKFGRDVILALGNTKNENEFMKELVAVRLSEDSARKLCGAIMGYFDE